MKSINKMFLLAVAGLAISIVTTQAQLALNFASISESTIQFNGAANNFQFNPSAGSQWQIGSETPGFNSAIGLYGGVGNGPFAYGPISQTIIAGYTIQSASVTGPLGILNIDDGYGYSLTGNVDWIQIETINSAGSINASVNVNVTSLAYSGANADLATLVANGPASMDLTFQFSPSMMLSQLSTGSGPYSTSYSGSISVPTNVPEPATVTFLLLGMGALAGTWRLKRGKQV